MALRVVALLRKKGKLEEAQPGESALDFLRTQAVRIHASRWPWMRSHLAGAALRLPCAFLEGFSLHANTWVHENDRKGLERLASSGARGPLSLERLSLLPDGRVAYRMKRPFAAGATELVLSPVAFLRRLAALIPPPGVHLVRFFGVLAPNARLRPLVVPRPPPLPAPPAAGSPLAEATRPSRVPWVQLLERTCSRAMPAVARLGWWPASSAPAVRLTLRGRSEHPDAVLAPRRACRGLLSRPPPAPTRACQAPHDPRVTRCPGLAGATAGAPRQRKGPPDVLEPCTEIDGDGPSRIVLRFEREAKNSSL